MRSVPAGLVCVAAIGLGSLTGAYVLPGAGGVDTPASPSTTAAPNRPPTSATPTPTAGPTPSVSPSTSPPATRAPSESDLLSVRSFADQSVEVAYLSQHGKADRTGDATSCVDDDVHQTATLKKITGYDPVLEGDWAQTDVGDEARQLVAVAEDAAGAETSVARLLAAMTTCQKAEPGHVVLGPATTENFSSTRSASWVGFYADEQNTTGRAPEGVEPCGGTLLARNGARFTTVIVFMCLDSTQLAGLAAAASERLG